MNLIFRSLLTGGFLVVLANGQGFLQPAHHPGRGPLPLPDLPIFSVEPDNRLNRPGHPLKGPFNVPKDAVVSDAGHWFERDYKVKPTLGEDLAVKWVCSGLACLAVVLCGILPAALLPIETGAALHKPCMLNGM